MGCGCAVHRLCVYYVTKSMTRTGGASAQRMGLCGAVHVMSVIRTRSMTEPGLAPKRDGLCVVSTCDVVQLCGQEHQKNRASAPNGWLCCLLSMRSCGLLCDKEASRNRGSAPQTMGKSKRHGNRRTTSGLLITGQTEGQSTFFL